MTAPITGGSTPRGLPYPGTDGELNQTYKYIRNLAEAIDSRLGTAGRFRLAYYQGTVTGSSPQGTMTTVNLTWLTPGSATTVVGASLMGMSTAVDLLENQGIFTTGVGGQLRSPWSAAYLGYQPPPYVGSATACLVGWSALT